MESEVIMADLLNGDNWTSVSGVGTTVVADRNVILKRIIVGGTYVGTINFHDSASAGGTTATSQVLSLGLPATSIPFDLDVNTNLKNGLVYQATGTPVLLFTWS